MPRVLRAGMPRVLRAGMPRVLRAGMTPVLSRGRHPILAVIAIRLPVDGELLYSKLTSSRDLNYDRGSYGDAISNRPYE
jgi:hypothetical protein